jgi:hypothetical protein
VQKRKQQKKYKMKEHIYTLVDGTTVEITQVPNDQYGNERYLVFDPSGKYDQFTFTPNGTGESDPMTPSQKIFLEEIAHLFS